MASSCRVRRVGHGVVGEYSLLADCVAALLVNCEGGVDGVSLGFDGSIERLPANYLLRSALITRRAGLQPMPRGSGTSRSRQPHAGQAGRIRGIRRTTRAGPPRHRWPKSCWRTRRTHPETPRPSRPRCMPAEDCSDRPLATARRRPRRRQYRGSHRAGNPSR